MGKIQDNSPKEVLSLDEVSFGNRNGIYHRSVWDILREEQSVLNEITRWIALPDVVGYGFGTCSAVTVADV